MPYVDGFVVPVKTARKADYIRISEQVCRLYLAAGATRCVETWGQDVPPGKHTSLPMAVALEADETVAFSWMEFPDKATRDAAHAAVWSDPAMEAAMDRSIVPGERMIFGGFEMVVDLA